MSNQALKEQGFEEKSADLSIAILKRLKYQTA